MFFFWGGGDDDADFGDHQHHGKMTCNKRIDTGDARFSKYNLLKFYLWTANYWTFTELAINACYKYTK